MSDASERAVLALHLADFALSDTIGKVNVIGLGVDVLGYEPAQGMTARFSVLAEVLIPSELAPAEVVVELALLDAVGEVVELPGPAGPQKLRIGQPVTIQKPGVHLPGTFPKEIRARHFMAIDFGNGLPLPVNNLYTWRLRVDGDDENARDLPFFVPGPPPGPVIG